MVGYIRSRSRRLGFLLLSCGKHNPVLLIELDDVSHEEESRRDRDTFVDAALTAAGLPPSSDFGATRPILHICHRDTSSGVSSDSATAQRSYVPAELAAAIQQQLQ